MVATLPEKVIEWISNTLSLDEINILQLKRHGTHALKVTDLKTLSYKIDQDLSDYCRNNNTSETMQEHHLVAAFGGERFHRPPSNAKKDAWIRYVQNCFYKNNLKSILVPKGDIIWKALDLEPPPECTSLPDESPGILQSSMPRLNSSIYSGNGLTGDGGLLDRSDSSSLLRSFHQGAPSEQGSIYENNHGNRENNNKIEDTEYNPRKSSWSRHEDVESTHGTEHSYGSSRMSDRNMSLNLKNVNLTRSAPSEDSENYRDAEFENKRRRTLDDTLLKASAGNLDAAQTADFLRKNAKFQVPEKLNKAALLKRSGSKMTNATVEEEKAATLSSSFLQNHQNDPLTLQQRQHLLSRELQGVGAYDQANPILGRSYLDLLREQTLQNDHNNLLRRSQRRFGSFSAPPLPTASAMHLSQAGDSLLSSLQRSQQLRNFETSASVALLNADRQSLASTSSFLGSLGEDINQQTSSYYQQAERALLLEQLGRMRDQQELLSQPSSLLSSSLAGGNTANQNLLHGRSSLLDSMSRDLGGQSAASPETRERRSYDDHYSTTTPDRSSTSLTSVLEEERRRILAAAASSPSLSGLSASGLISTSTLSEEARARSVRNQAVLQSLDARQMIENQWLQMTKTLGGASELLRHEAEKRNQNNVNLRTSGLSSLTQSSVEIQDEVEQLRSQSKGGFSHKDSTTRSRINEGASIIRRKTKITREGSSSPPSSKGKNSEHGEGAEEMNCSSRNSSAVGNQHKQQSEKEMNNSLNGKSCPHSFSSSDEVVPPTIRNHNKTPSIVTTSTKLSEPLDEKVNAQGERSSQKFISRGTGYKNGPSCR